MDAGDVIPQLPREARPSEVRSTKTVPGSCSTKGATAPKDWGWRWSGLGDGLH